MDVFYTYSYDQDHLGNIRQVIHPSSWYEQPQINNYYPYGGQMANSSNQDLQRYKYNGKELDRMHGLDRVPGDKSVAHKIDRFVWGNNNKIGKAKINIKTR